MRHVSAVCSMYGLEVIPAMQEDQLPMSSEIDIDPAAAAWPSSFTLGPTSYGITVNGGKPALGDALPQFADPGPLRLVDPRPVEPAQGKVQEIPIDIEVVIGRTKVSVAKLMSANEGDRFLLDRRFGEPVELQVNGRVIGHGELVADDYDNFIGIRITSVERDR